MRTRPAQVKRGPVTSEKKEVAFDQLEVGDRVEIQFNRHEDWPPKTTFTRARRCARNTGGIGLTWLRDGNHDPASQDP